MEPAIGLLELDSIAVGIRAGDAMVKRAPVAVIYALIPGPKGMVVARGAVMSYREFLQPQANRLTDEAWRRKIAGDEEPARPEWLSPIYAEAVPAIALVGEGVGRCGPMSGARIDL